jgi:hypothetical protein
MFGFYGYLTASDKSFLGHLVNGYSDKQPSQFGGVYAKNFDFLINYDSLMNYDSFINYLDFKL